MRLIRRRPFLCLALLTIAVGVAWHSPLGQSAPVRDALFVPVAVLGAPFIGAMRMSTALLGRSAVTPILGLLLGLSPYLVADWLLQRWRMRAQTR